MWRARTYDEDEVARFRRGDGGEHRAGGADPCRLPAQLRERGPRDPREVAAPRWSTRCAPATQIGARAVVLHPGHREDRRRRGGDRARRRDDQGGARGERALPAAPREHRRRRRHARAHDRRARGAARGERRRSSASGVCLDSCHLFASGYDIRTPAGMDALTRELTAQARAPAPRLAAPQRLGSRRSARNRDRHANIGAGELGESGCAAFLGAPTLQRLPCVLETPGEKGTGASGEEVVLAKRLHQRGMRAIGARKPAARPAPRDRMSPVRGCLATRLPAPACSLRCAASARGLWARRRADAPAVTSHPCSPPPPPCRERAHRSPHQ